MQSLKLKQLSCINHASLSTRFQFCFLLFLNNFTHIIQNFGHLGQKMFINEQPILFFFIKQAKLTLIDG